MNLARLTCAFLAALLLALPAQATPNPVVATITPFDESAVITFTPPPDNGSPITGYEVADEMQVVFLAAAGSPITLTGLTNGVTYTFYIRAVNANGPGLFSALQVTPAGPPAAPGFAFANVAGDRSIGVGCLAAESDLEVLDYTATISPGGATVSGGPFCSMLFDNLTPGVAYTFTVVATSQSGSSPASPASDPVTAVTFPGAPTGVSAVAGTSQATVTFTPPTDTGFGTIQYYLVRAVGSGVETLGNDSPVVITGLPNGQTDTFTVTAFNEVGEGPASAPSNSVTPMAFAPDAPRSARAMGGDGRATVSFLAPDFDGGEPITSYQVTATPGGASGTGTRSPIGVTGLANGTEYTFTVTAINSVGPGTASNATNGVTPAPVFPRTAAYAYVPNAADNMVAVINTVTDRVVDTIPVGTLPRGVAVNPAGTRVYVTNEGDNTVSVIDATNHAVVATVDVDSGPFGVAVNPSGNRAYVANSSAGTVSVIDTAINVVVDTINLFGSAVGVAMHPSGSSVYVSRPPDTSVVVISTSNNSVTAMLSTGALPAGLVVSGGNLWSSSPVQFGFEMGRVPLTGGSASPIDLGGANVGFGIAADPVSGRIFMARPISATSVTGAGFVSTHDGASAPTGDAPRGVSVTPSTRKVFVANQGSNSVTVIDSVTLNVLATIPVGLEPIALGSFIGPDPVPAVPDAPGNVVATAGNAQATVSFPAAFDGGSPITSYTVTASPGGASASGPASPITVTALVNGTTYTFTVRATNVVGQGPPSAPSNGVVPRTVPSAPASVSALAGNGQVSVTFSSPASNGGGFVSGYTVTCNPGAISASGSSSPIIVGGLTNGVSYSCSVTATNEAGTGAASAIATATPSSAQYLLMVARTGSGSGRISSSPAAIDCGSVCVGAFASGSVVTLTPTPDAGSTFGGWTGACTGTGACNVNMNGSTSALAIFTIVKSSQTIAFTNPGPRTVSTTPLALVASATSGLPVTVVSNTPAVCTVSGANVTLVAVGTCTLTASQAGDASFNAAPSVQLSFGVTAANPPRLGNISTRMQVLTGDDVMIGGFIIGGSASKTVVVRARGPSLTAAGLTGVIGNPNLQLFSGATQIAANDDFGTAANLAALQASGFAPDHPQESAILVQLDPGAYTAIVSGVGGTTGVGIVEVFEVDAFATPLINIATRGRVQTGDNVMIAGLIVQGDGPQTVVVRARGPSLGQQGVAGALANPQLSLFFGATRIGENDNWGDASNAAAIQSSGFAPDHPNEAAILVTLQPGAYTAIVTGVGGTTGVAIVEVFKN